MGTRFLPDENKLQDAVQPLLVSVYVDIPQSWSYALDIYPVIYCAEVGTVNSPEWTEMHDLANYWKLISVLCLAL